LFSICSRARPVVGDERERRAKRRAVPVDARPGGDRDEARVRLRVVADVGLEDGEPVQLSRSLARDRGFPFGPAFSDVLCSVRRRRHRDHGRVREPREQLAALVERHRVRVDDPHLLRRELRRPEQEVPDRQHGLAHDREWRIPEQIVCLRDGPDKRALDRQHAVLDLARGNGFGHGPKRRERHRLLAGEELGARRCAVRTFAPWIRDHGSVRTTPSASPRARGDSMS